MATLIVTEKPKVAERIAKALGTSVKKQIRNKIAYYEVGDNIVAPAVGHIYGLKEKKQQWTYPVFDIEWAPSYLVSKGSDFTKGYLNNLNFLSKKCDKFINACDFDIEGSVIGFNAIKYACNTDPYRKNVYRMKYSTLTKEAIIKSYQNLDPIQKEMVDAGLTRHTLDWYWGINLSRALTTSVKKARRYVTLSIGRVQGPALKILAEREKQIKAFISEPYWEVEQIAKSGDKKISALHEKSKFWDEKEAKDVKERCGNKTIVSKIEKKKFKQAPPHPFDLTTLQTESYSQMKIDPRRTLEIAQDLYTSGFISYPRTSSQQLPEDINFKEILTKLSGNKNYGQLCEKLLIRGKLVPNNGKKTDPAHPAIHPTGEKAAGLDLEHKKIYDLIVHRFLATFGDSATRETVKIYFDNNSEIFIAKGTRTIERGWHILYGKYAKFEEEELPELKEGDVLLVIEIKIHGKETKPPKRYTPASIIREMEKNNIGTKATRSQIIDILFKRNYVDGRSLEVTQLGLDVVETLDKFCPEVLSIDLTRKFEDEMVKIRAKKYSSETVVDEGRKMVTKISKEFKKNELKIGEELAKSISETTKKQSVVGKCLKCSGDLAIRQGKYGNFIGCSNYPDCKFTLPLPAGLIKKEGKCEECGYAILVKIAKGRRPWKFCVNPECPTRKKAEAEAAQPGTDVSKTSRKEHSKDKKPIVVGKCLKCGGDLIIRQNRYGGNFVGCNNYPKCRVIISLPSGLIEKKGECKECGYAIVRRIVEGKTPFEFCVNPECPSKKKKEQQK